MLAKYHKNKKFLQLHKLSLVLEDQKDTQQAEFVVLILAKQ
jgi:hypothetical protein